MKKVLVPQASDVVIGKISINTVSPDHINCPIVSSEHLAKFGLASNIEGLRSFGAFNEQKAVCIKCKRCTDAIAAKSSGQKDSICDKIRKDLKTPAIEKSINCPLSA